MTPASDLLLVSKLPVPGRVKTRLAATIGSESASEVAAALLGDQLQGCGLIGDTRVLCGDQPDSSSFSRWLSDGSIAPYRWEYRHQGDGDLGTRLVHCCALSFGQGRTAVALLGADAPRYSPQQIETALHRAAAGSATIGPAGDGGYGLLVIPRVVERHLRALFPRQGWGGPAVAENATNRLQELGVPVQSLPVRDDIDVESDLVGLWRELQRNRHLATRLSRTFQQLRNLRKEGWRGAL